MGSVFCILLSIFLSSLLILASNIAKEVSKQLKSDGYKVISILILLFDPSTLLCSLFSCIVAKYICDFIFVT